MRDRRKYWRWAGAVGTALMAASCLLPWAIVGVTVAVQPVSGFEHGAGVLLALACLAGLAVLLGTAGGVLIIGIVASLWMLLVVYETPGSLVDSSVGVGIAEMTYGALAALLGSLVVGASGAVALHARARG